MPTNNGDNKFAVKQIQGDIQKKFLDLIDLRDLEKTRIDKSTAFLSRGLAAYTLHTLADISPNEAAQSVIDGTGDNGLDAIFWHKNNNVLWLIQSKWIKKGSGQPEYKDINNFSTGVKNLINDDLDRPNSKLLSKKDEVENALSTIGVKVKIIIAHTGQGISKPSHKSLENTIRDLNINESDEGAFSYDIFDRDKAYSTAVENANRLNIETTLNLSNWGKMDDPYTAFYGQVNALELAKLWDSYKNKLFARNLRDFIGRTKANDDISQTLKEDPASFWYFNNGVTILCDELQKKTRSTKRLNDDFWCRGLSIINGAQTIGSIGRLYEEDPEKYQDNLEQTEVFVKLISLKDCPDGFDVQVTRATNTQNHVDSRDFVSLDSVQQRLAREIKTWDADKTYFYKRSEDMVSNESSCTLTESTTALSSYSGNLELISLAKKDIAEIWSDTSSSFYKQIFNPSVSAIKLWRTVEIYRLVKKYLFRKSKDSKLHKKISDHADLFVAYLVFNDIKDKKVNIFNPDIDSEDYELLELLRNSRK